MQKAYKFTYEPILGLIFQNCICHAVTDKNVTMTVCFLQKNIKVSVFLSFLCSID